MTGNDIVELHGYEIRPFSELTKPYQYAMIHYMSIHGGAWEAIEPDGAFGEHFEKENDPFLDAYVAKYGDELFGVALIPVETAIRAYMESATIGGDFKSFEDYQAWYVGAGDMPNHPETDRWPAILDNDDPDEVFQDGNHRLHSYIASGHKDIPVMFYPQEVHLENSHKPASKAMKP